MWKVYYFEHILCATFLYVHIVSVFIFHLTENNNLAKKNIIGVLSSLFSYNALNWGIIVYKILNYSIFTIFQCRQILFTGTCVGPKRHKINNAQNNIYFCGTKPIRQHISHFSVVHCFPGCLMHYR